jgi:hypothetical protein
MTINELLDRAKTRANLPSDYALAKAVGIPQSTVTGWRKAKRHPSNEEAIQLATLAGLEEMPVIAQIELETANTEKKKAFWTHYIESRGITAIGAMVIIGSGLILQLPNYDEKRIYSLENNNIHYANFGRGELGTVCGTVSPFT